MSNRWRPFKLKLSAILLPTFWTSRIPCNIYVSLPFKLCKYFVIFTGLGVLPLNISYWNRILDKDVITECGWLLFIKESTKYIHKTSLASSTLHRLHYLFLLLLHLFFFFKLCFYYNCGTVLIATSYQLLQTLFLLHIFIMFIFFIFFNFSSDFFFSATSSWF